MPYVKVEITKDGVTKEQKQQVIAGITRVLVDVLNKDPQTTHIVIQEVELDNWGYLGKQVSDIRKH
jgi:4-oxalocrotonate tautomerase family enzyme